MMCCKTPLIHYRAAKRSPHPVCKRLMGVGYPRAVSLMEQLEDAGVVGPEVDRRKGREVLLD